VFRGPGARDYRIPDFSFVSRGRERIITPDGIRGGPDAVLEIVSPDDETFEKFPFFAAIGVREVIAIGRDSKKVEVFRLAGRRYAPVRPSRDGWVEPTVPGVRFKRSGRSLLIRDVADPSRSTRI
jgi:Uma2 family endonuclease